MRRKETGYGHMWLCSVVARAALRKAKGLGFQPHGARSVTILREKCRDLRLDGLGRLVAG
jgi:hypothetical protein